MTLQQLQYIVEISRAGSITAAAKNLFITQPSLSRSVRQLESELGITILERSHIGVIFTAEGMELLNRAQRILQQTNDLNVCFKKEKHETPALSISTQHYTFVVASTIRMIREFQNQFRNYQITVNETSTNGVIQNVISGASEIGILCTSTYTRRFLQQTFEQDGLTFSDLAELTSRVYVRRGHPLAGLPAVSIEQLASYPCVWYIQDKTSPYYTEESVFFGQTQKTIYLNDQFMVLNVLANTDAYNFGSGLMHPGLTPDSIVTLPILGNASKMQIGFITSRHRKNSAAVETLIAEMKKMISIEIEGLEHPANLD